MMNATNAGIITYLSPLLSNSFPVKGLVANVAMAYTTKKKLLAASRPLSCENGVRNVSRLE